MKKNQGNQPRRSRGGGPRPKLKRCKKCGYHQLRAYFKNHVCRVNEDGTLDTWEPYGEGRARGRKTRR